jgi:inner membrane protein
MKNLAQNHSETTQNSLTHSIKESITLKFILVGGLILLLLIPSFMVRSVIEDRINYQNQVVEEIGSSTGKPQFISGLVLEIPKIVLLKNGKTSKTSIYIIPEKIDIKTNLTANTKKKGIYEAVVYQSPTTINGNFDLTQLKEKYSPQELVLSNATIHFLINDLKGLSNEIKMNFDNQIIALNNPKSIGEVNDLYQKTNIGELKNLNFNLNVELKGSEKFWYYPLSKQTNVRLESNWENINFDGDFARENSSNNNISHWKVNSLNTGIPSLWEGDLADYVNLNQLKSNQRETLGFGIKLIQSGDHYKLSDRASKYTILVLVLNFLALLIFEMRSKIKIHIIQYLLIGLSICLFYLLLLSISEYVGFELSYLIASLVISGLIFFYSKGIFTHLKPAFILTSLIGLLYVYVYITLKLSDSALITGTIGLTIIMSVVMQFTKDLNKNQ